MTVVNGVAKGVSKGVVVTLFGDIRRFQASLTAPKDGICVRDGGKGEGRKGGREGRRE